MLKSIYIKDFAIINELRIDFESGFNVFTGETGAGKSIIVGALSFLKGNRADVSFIRKGATKAIIEGVFSIDEHVKKILDENDIDYDDDLVIYRTLSSDSKNTIRVNNRTVTLNLLSEIIGDSVDIHSQKDSQYLLKNHNQLLMVDAFMNDIELLNEVSTKYDKYKKLDNEYKKYLDTNDSTTDIEYYRYQIKEIEDANLQNGEEEKLEIISKRAKNSKKYIEHLNNAISLFEENDGIDEKLYQAIKELDFSDDLETIHDNLLEKYYEIEELFNQTKKLLSDIDISEDEINQTEERLYIINRLKRKYHTDVEGILKIKDELIERICAFDNRQEYIYNYETAISKAFKEYQTWADKLSKKRYDAAKNLSKLVMDEVNDLELKYFNFEIYFNETSISSLGKDAIEFMISTNKGEDLKPLSKIASGGEMSRIMLALKTIFSKLSNVSLVVFDEIDTGVSGKAATSIGLKMAKISKYTQVLSITHLAQVASFADNQYFVRKVETDERIVSNIELLDEENRIKELALMSLSSTNDSALKVAKELLEDSLKLKNRL